MQEASMNSGGVTVSDSPTPGNLFDEFEEAFQNCLAPLTKEDPLNGMNQEELKVNAESNSQRFLELAHRMEAFFLQKRFLLSVQKPEALISEENTEMRLELQRKEELIKKQTEKLGEFQNTLMNLISRVGSMPGNSGRGGIPTSMAQQTSSSHASPSTPVAAQTSTPTPASVGHSPAGSTGSQSSMNTSTNVTQSTMMSPARMGSGNANVSGMGQGNFSPMSSGPMQGSPMGPGSGVPSSMNTSGMGAGGPSLSSNMGPTSVSGGNPMQGGPVQPTSGMYSGMGTMNTQSQGLQGPLAFLEKTTTNIGMPEGRR